MSFSGRILLLIFFACAVRAEAQAIRYCGSALFGNVARDAWSVYGNPAGLGFENGIRIGVAQLNRYTIGNWNDATALFITCPNQGPHVGIGLRKEGFPGFNSLRVPVVVSVRPSVKSAIGVRIESIATTVGEKTDYSAGSAFGAVLDLSASTCVGFIISQPEELFRKQELAIRPSTVWSAGATWKASSLFRCTAELDTDAESYASRIGITYSPGKGTECRIGYSFAERQFACGFGFELKRYLFDFSLQHHPFLGFSGGIGAEWILR